MSKENGLVGGLRGSVGIGEWKLISGIQADSAVCERDISRGTSLFLADSLPMRWVDVCMFLFFWWKG